MFRNSYVSGWTGYDIYQEAHLTSIGIETLLCVRVCIHLWKLARLFFERTKLYLKLRAFFFHSESLDYEKWGKPVRNDKDSVRVLMYIEGPVIASFLELWISPEHTLKHHVHVSDAPKQLLRPCKRGVTVVQVLWQSFTKLSATHTKN